MRRRIFGVAGFVALLACGTSTVAQADDIRVRSTTDTVDAGLVEFLIPKYNALYPGDNVLYTGEGTGAALQSARNGLADVTITHAPSLEAQFVADGYSLETLGRQIFYSDYVIVGPNDDPANVLANHPHDAVGALEDIAAAGGTGNADFLSRADNSGTNVQEQKMWGLTTTVTKSQAANFSSDTTRFEPGTGGPSANVYPGWYKRQTGGQAQNLDRAEACPTATYTSGKCYTILDRGTFNRKVNNGTVTTLKIVSEHNTSSARGGQDLLINPFSAYIVNPAKAPYPNGTTPNVAAATRFVDFLTSQAFQADVDTFPSTTDPAFHADAFARVSLTSSLPPVVAAGGTVPIHLQLTNKLPGSAPINGMPVQLQKSTNGGAYTDVGGSQGTSGSGAVSFAPAISATTRFRLSMPRYNPTSAQSSSLSPNTQEIGVVSVPGPPAAGDKKKPGLSKIKLYSRKVTARVSEAATIKVRISRRVKKSNGKFTYRSARLVTIKAKKSGNISRKWKSRLKRGKYKVTLRATDPGKNTRVLTVHRNR